MTWSLSIGFILLAICVPATASVLDIQFTGLDLVYDGTRLTDAGVNNDVGQGMPSQSDSLLSMSFLRDGVLAGPVLTTNIASDILLKGVSGIASSGGFVTSGGNGDGFGIDLLTKNQAANAWGLALNADKVNVAYSGNGFGLWVIGQAVSVFTQSLPYGLVIDSTQPISFTFSSVLVKDVQVNAGVVTHFTASGTGSIKATLVPEPVTAGLLLLGCVLSLRSRRHWKL